MGTIGRLVPSKPTFLLAVCFGFASGCAGDRTPQAEPAPSVTALLGSSSSQFYRTRGDSYERDEAVIARVEQARLDPAGRVVVLDAVPPFLKTFREDGTFERAFVGMGAGPGEARMPFGLGIASNSNILLIHDAFVTELSPAGELISNVPFDALGFLPLAATGGCDNQWVLYGPESLKRRPAANGWIFTKSVEAPWNGPLRAVYSDSIVPASIGFGALQGLVGTQDRIFIYHRFPHPPGILELSCQAATVQGIPEISELFRASSRPTERQSEEGLSLSIAAGSRSFAGISMLEDGWIVAMRVQPVAGEPTRTELTLVHADSMYRASLEARLSIEDGIPGTGVLFSESDLIPRVFLLREDDLVDAFRRVPPGNKGTTATGWGTGLKGGG